MATIYHFEICSSFYSGALQTILNWLAWMQQNVLKIKQEDAHLNSEIQSKEGDSPALPKSMSSQHQESLWCPNHQICQWPGYESVASLHGGLQQVEVMNGCCRWDVHAVLWDLDVCDRGWWWESYMEYQSSELNLCAAEVWSILQRSKNISDQRLLAKEELEFSTDYGQQIFPLKTCNKFH